VPVQMNQTVMNFYLNYTSRSKDGQLIVHSLPKEWVELFKAAKVRPKELKNPDTVVFLLQLMEEQLAKMDRDGGGGVHEEAGEPSNIVLKESSDEPAENPAPSSSELTLDVVQSLPVLFRVKAYTPYQKSNPDDISIKEGTRAELFFIFCSERTLSYILLVPSGDIIFVHKTFDNGWWHGTLGSETGYFPGSYCEKIEEDAPPPLTLSAEATPHPPPLPHSSAEGPSPQSSSIPLPPKPPAAPPLPVASASVGDGGKPAGPVAASSRGNMLSQIREGPGQAGLKRVGEGEKIGKLNTRQRNDLVGIMAEQMEERRKAMREVVEENDDDNWDEWEEK
jgi:hypothetical protein